MSRIIRTEPNAQASKAVEYHGFVFTGGVVARDASADIHGQTRDVLAQIDAVLETHGTDNTRLLQAQIQVKRTADLPGFEAAWSAWLPEGAAPALTVMQAELPNPASLVQVAVVTCK